MTAAPALGLGVGEGADLVLGYLAEVLAALDGVACPGDGVAVDHAVRVDRISLLEQIKAAAAAAQASEMVRFARSQVAAQRDAGVDYRRLGQGIAEQIGLATRTGAWHGARKLRLAWDLATDLPGTFDCSPEARSVSGAGGTERPGRSASVTAARAGHHDLVQRPASR